MRHCIYIALLCLTCIGFGLHPRWANAATVVDCNKIIIEAKTKDISLNPDDVQQCIKRGWDAPPNLRPKNLSNAPGARGFSYGGAQSPANSPGALKVKASVSKDVITTSCNFPPKVKIGFPPKITFEKGSCYDFLNDVFKDKNGATNSSPAPTGLEPSSCPVADDTTGVYGIKQPIPSDSTITPECGGMAPLTTTNIVLNANPDSFVSTEEGAYYLWYYKKSGTRFTSLFPDGHAIALPKYLCKLASDGDSGTVWVKSVDLTAPTAQMITYNASAREIRIRLRPRESMDTNFIPPYVEDEPTKYLIIPLDAAGTPQVPDNCADDSIYFKTTTTPEDIYIESSTISGCERSTSEPTTSIEYTYSCTTGTVSGTKCIDPSTSAVVGPATRSAPIAVQKCPGNSTPVGGVCPQSAGTITSTSYMACEKGKLSGSSCVDATTGALIGPAKSAETEASCGTSAASSGANCDVVTVTLKGGICDGKTQYGVLNQPNLYYPPSDPVGLYHIDGRSAVMLTTTANSTLYTQSKTIFHLQATAPAITLKEGGLIDLPSGDILIMSPLTTINPATRQVTMKTGGQLTSSGGIQKASFADGGTYTLPGSDIIKVRVSRSANIPAGFLYPSMAKVGITAPYIRHPINKPPI